MSVHLERTWETEYVTLGAYVGAAVGPTGADVGAIVGYFVLAWPAALRDWKQKSQFTVMTYTLIGNILIDTMNIEWVNKQYYSFCNTCSSKYKYFDNLYSVFCIPMAGTSNLQTDWWWCGPLRFLSKPPPTSTEMSKAVNEWLLKRGMRSVK